MFFKKILIFVVVFIVFIVAVAHAEDSRLEAGITSKQKKFIAITFDDGPNYGTTSKILDELEKRNLRATFFVLGVAASTNKTILARMKRNGSEVANHTYSHPNLTKIDASAIKSEMSRTSEIIKDATGRLPTLMRPPGGAVNQEVIIAARQLGMATVIWSLDPEDWKHRNSNYIASYVLENAKSGDVILLHDTHHTTANAVPEILDRLVSAGFTFVTVSEMLQIDQNLTAENRIPWYRKASETFPGLIKVRVVVRKNSKNHDRS